MPAPSQHAFSEKVVLINGGTSPIGRAVAMQLALYGAFVVIAHQENDTGIGDLEELKSLGTLAASVSYTGRGVERAVFIAGEVEKLYGRLDFLVNCPEAVESGAFASMTDSLFSKVMENSFESVFFLIKECKRLMIDRPKPRIINIFSACDGEIPDRNVLLKSVNGSIAELTSVLAGEFPSHFRINAMRVSEKNVSKQNDSDLDPELFRVKTGVEPDDVARTALFLLSSEATGLNGQILNIG